MTYDAIVIGSGAGGATLAHALAPSGLRILILERGEYLRREKDNWNANAVFNEQRYTTDERWLDKWARPFRPGAHYNVGGATKFYGAALLRFRSTDFGEVRHHGGISPAWPLAYDDLEPYYTQAEHLYRVRGVRGVDPTEPPASAPYLYPPVSHETRIAELERDFRSLGLHPFPLPMGVMLDEADAEASRCIRCSTCDGFPCLVDAKADAHTICIRAALAYPNVSLETGALVTRLETDASGRSVTSVVVSRNGREERFAGNVVVLSAGAVNSAVLLLRSANERHPNGLANSSDVVGRHYMAHNNSAMIAVSKRKNPTVFQKTLGVNDYYYGADDFPYPLGHFQLLGKSEAAEFKGDAEIRAGLRARKTCRTPTRFLAHVGGPTRPEQSRHRSRRRQISLSYTENNLKGHRRLLAKLKDVLGTRVARRS